MLEGLLYLMTSFWLGAAHAATPGHGKTIAASYIVGVRGRPIDALVLGVLVTLSHTSGIVLVAVLATLGSAWLIPQRVEAYLAVGTGILVVGIGSWMLRTQMQAVAFAARQVGSGTPGVVLGVETEHPHQGEGGVFTREQDAHAHPHGHGAHTRGPADPGPHFHSHGWGRVHTHDTEAVAEGRSSLSMLLALSIASGLLPDPGALAILLSAIASGKLILGLFTVLVFSLGFASVLVVVGVAAAQFGQRVLTWLSSRWISWVQIGTALVIIVVGFALTASAIRTLTALR